MDPAGAGTVKPGLEKATFGAGWFWDIEAELQKVKGIKSTAVGYAGGKTVNPTYESVCSGATGHAEVVQVEYDPAEISYEQILDLFWKQHNPTAQLGGYRGGQYRSAIFYHTPKQAEIAKASRDKLAAQLRKTITTEITAAPTFYKAEDYHQSYYRKRGGVGACRLF